MEKLDYNHKSEEFKKLMAASTEIRSLTFLLQLTHITNQLHKAGLYNGNLTPDNLMIKNLGD